MDLPSRVPQAPDVLFEVFHVLDIPPWHDAAVTSLLTLTIATPPSSAAAIPTAIDLRVIM